MKKTKPFFGDSELALPSLKTRLLEIRFLSALFLLLVGWASQAEADTLNCVTNCDHSHWFPFYNYANVMCSYTGIGIGGGIAYDKYPLKKNCGDSVCISTTYAGTLTAADVAKDKADFCTNKMGCNKTYHGLNIEDCWDADPSVGTSYCTLTRSPTPTPTPMASVSMSPTPDSNDDTPAPTPTADAE